MNIDRSCLGAAILRQLSSMWRLYVDESGDHTYGRIDAADRRYLALVGCAFDLQIYQQRFQPQFEALKSRHFPRHDPDEPVILHRDDVINARGPFRVLLNMEAREAFNHELLTLIRETAFTLVAIVIDKKNHTERYGEAAWHPYHYCLTVLMERYCGYLNFVRQKGDVLAESRGKTEDAQLKAEYARIYREGVYHRSAKWFQSALSSHEIKLKPKSKNVAGLQLADLIAHPIKQEILAERKLIPALGDNFGRRLCETLVPKYNRQVYSGQIWGYGKKLLD